MPKVKLLMWDVSKLYTIAKNNYFEDEIIKIINNFLFYASR